MWVIIKLPFILHQIQYSMKRTKHIEIVYFITEKILSIDIITKFVKSNLTYMLSKFPYFPHIITFITNSIYMTYIYQLCGWVGGEMLVN